VRKEFRLCGDQGSGELKFVYRPDDKRPNGRTAVDRGGKGLEAFREWLGK